LEQVVNGKSGITIRTSVLEKALVWNIFKFFKPFGRMIPFPLADLPGGLKFSDGIMRQPVAEIVASESGLHQWELTYETVVSILARAELQLDGTYSVVSTRPFSIGWVYAKTDEAFAKLLEKKGDISIDCKDYFLLIYNPNGEIEYTKFQHSRGCWMVSTLNEQTGGIYFRVMTRGIFETELGADLMNVSFDFVQETVVDGELQPQVVHFTYRTLPLPPTMAFKCCDNGAYDTFNMPDSRAIKTLDDWATELMRDPKAGTFNEITQNLITSVMSLEYPDDQ
jgi:hypothetical protein